MKLNWKLLIGVTLVALGTIGAALNGWTRAHVVEVWKQLSATEHGGESRPDKSWISPLSTGAEHPWDRLLTIDAAQERAIGLKTVVVKPQTEPTVLKLF